MTRSILLGFAALAAVGALAGTAAATPPIHFTVPFAGAFSAPAGTICDFNYSETFSGTDDVTIFSDGRVEVHEKIQVSHTNDDTGYTLTESDHINYYNFAPLGPGAQRLTAVNWHLRDADGKIVVVQAGQILRDENFNIVKFTPNMNPDFAAVICPALGGNPA